MTDPASGGPARNVGSETPSATPSGRGRGAPGPIGHGGGGSASNLRRRGAPPAPGQGNNHDGEWPSGRVHASKGSVAPEGASVPLSTEDIGKGEVHSVLKTFRDEILATVSQALSQRPAGQDGSRGRIWDERSGSHSRRFRRRRSPSSSSSSSSGATLTCGFHHEDRHTRRSTHTAPPMI